ncbi:MAG TPA: hypothetical protein VLZ03_06155 [Thermodesulfobacteriota bacterium]|nr:hypothetical protein [Thermodesulfobacteriota bacterium]
MSWRALIQVTLNAGLMKTRRGFTLVAGNEKGEGERQMDIDKK